jgi:hypothetical protein
MTLSRNALWLIAGTLILGGQPVLAQDEPTENKPTADQPARAEDGEPAGRDPKAEPARPRVDDDERLFRRLTGQPVPEADGTGAAAAAENPLEKAVAGMRSARERLEQGRTDDETRSVQEDVVRDLQKLIDLAEQAQQQRQQSQSQANRSSQDRQQDRQQGGANASNPQVGGATAGEPRPVPGSQQQERAAQSRDIAREATGAGVEEDRDSLFEGVWGHLPPAMRHKLLSLDGGKYLEKYSDLRRLYFKALAGENQRDR